MAQSKLPFQQYSSELFVESCGAILFDLSNPQDKRVCLIHYLKHDQWLLAKGRRNCGESRKEAALREVREETGFQGRLYPVLMPTRAPPIDEPTDLPDKPRVCSDIKEPFMCTVRELRNGKGVKIIWWYIAVLEEGGQGSKMQGEDHFESAFFTCEKAIEMLYFESDRDVLRKAIQIVEDTLSHAV